MGGLNGDDFFYGTDSSIEDELIEQVNEDTPIDDQDDTPYVNDI